MTPPEMREPNATDTEDHLRALNLRRAFATTIYMTQIVNQTN